MNKNGFTLVELLVVISIMAILSSVAVASYSGITAKARDSQRIKDLQAIKQGLELYRSDIHNYPTRANFPLFANPASLVGTGITYLQVPQDKNSTNNYVYQTVPSDCDNSTAVKTCLNFILCAKKEGTGTSYDLSVCSEYFCGLQAKCDIGIYSD